MEFLLEELRSLCLNTSGTKFTITVLRDGKWKISFSNSQKIPDLSGDNLILLLRESIDNIKKIRVKKTNNKNFSVWT